jgi:hypothetical protein
MKIYYINTLYTRLIHLLLLHRGYHLYIYIQTFCCVYICIYIYTHVHRYIYFYIECWRWNARSMLSCARDSKGHGSGLTAETTRLEVICPTMRLRWKRTGRSLRRWWKPRVCIRGWSWITTKSGLCSMRLQRRLCGRTEFTAHKYIYIYVYCTY